MTVGLYQPGSSVLHAMRPGLKLLALPIAGTLLFTVPSPIFAACALCAVLALFFVARLQSSLWRQLRPSLPVLAVIFLAQWWLVDGAAAALSVLRLTALMLLAALMTLTTRTSDIVATLERAFQPLRPLGADPAKISLAISMTLRFIPMVAAIVSEISEAQAARGMERNVLRLSVPVIVRLLKASDELADAIDARS